MNRWHVGPIVDTLAYAFSWALILVPLELLSGREAQLTMFLLVDSSAILPAMFLGIPWICLSACLFADAV